MSRDEHRPEATRWGLRSANLRDHIVHLHRPRGFVIEREGDGHGSPFEKAPNKLRVFHADFCTGEEAEIPSPSQIMRIQNIVALAIWIEDAEHACLFPDFPRRFDEREDFGKATRKSLGRIDENDFAFHLARLLFEFVRVNVGDHEHFTPMPPVAWRGSNRAIRYGEVAPSESELSDG